MKRCLGKNKVIYTVTISCADKELRVGIEERHVPREGRSDGAGARAGMGEHQSSRGFMMT